MTKFGPLLFALGLGFLLSIMLADLPFGDPPMRVGSTIQTETPQAVGSAKIVTAVVLAYRGIDTLGELSILFAAATGVGLVLGHRRKAAVPQPPEHGFAPGYILRMGTVLLFPLLIVVGLYIILHGHLTPGGGFQGGVILAAAFLVLALARPKLAPGHQSLALVEGLAGAAFITTGILALLEGQAFLTPLLDRGELGSLISSGTLPILYLAVGLKVGAELTGLLLRMTEEEAE